MGALPAATSVLLEVRKLWTRQSPAVVNGTPYSLYEFPVNLQITSNVIALHLDSVLCFHVYLPPISDYALAADKLSLGAPLGAPVSRGQTGPGGTLPPLARSKLAGHSKHKLGDAGVVREPSSHPLSPPPTVMGPSFLREHLSNPCCLLLLW